MFSIVAVRFRLLSPPGCRVLFEEEKCVEFELLHVSSFMTRPSANCSKRGLP